MRSTSQPVEALMSERGTAVRLVNKASCNAVYAGLVVRAMKDTNAMVPKLMAKVSAAMMDAAGIAYTYIVPGKIAIIR